MVHQALPGFRDFFPEEMALRRHIESAWHAAARGAGFEEIDGPPLESLDLLKAKSGDAIVEEIYAFTDKGGRGVGLRPEFTPTLGRMIAERAAALKKPVKWYCVPQLFRYQRQQRGRLREHVQWNLDVVGADEVAADAEAVAVAVDGLRRLGLTDEHVHVRVNDRRIMNRRLADYGFEDHAERRLRSILDKREKLAEEAFSREIADFLAETGTGAKATHLLDAVTAPIDDEPELAEFLAACADYGIASFVTPDVGIVRGLDYYTGIVYEIFDRKHKLRALAGGGRYDRLVETLGGPALAALGFGMGDVVLGELLKDLKLLPSKPPRIDAYVIPAGEEMLAAARQVVRHLRDRGVAAEAPYATQKFGKAFKAAEAAGARRAVIVGADEWKDESVQVKDLESGEQETVRFEALE